MSWEYRNNLKVIEEKAIPEVRDKFTYSTSNNKFQIYIQTPTYIYTNTNRYIHTHTHARTTHTHTQNTEYKHITNLVSRYTQILE